MMVDLYNDILEAHRGIRPQVAVTPLQHSQNLSALSWSSSTARLSTPSWPLVASAYQGRTVAVVLCGRNIGLERFIAAVSH